MKEYKKPVIEIVELAFSGNIATLIPPSVFGGNSISNGDSGINLLVTEDAVVGKRSS